MRSGIAVLSAATVFFVNMQTGDGNYQIGRYENGQPAPVGAVATGSGLWAPSAISARGITWLYVAEHETAGFKNLVLFTAAPGEGFVRRGVVLRDDRQVLTPAVAYDPARDTFDLWYSRGGAVGEFAAEIVHASSASGLAFSSDGVKYHAGTLTGPVGVAYAFRDAHGWSLLIHDYTGSNLAANPHVLTFADPSQLAYIYGGPLTVERETGVPSIDASYVCQRSDGTWWGLFTEWAAPAPRWAWEWTVAETAPTLLGPWSVDHSSAIPYLPFQNGLPMISVENPAAPDASVELDAC